MESFHAFANLPAEIRLKIWYHSVPDDEPEVCLLWPATVPSTNIRDERAMIPCQPLTVDVPFPAAMHVCREARCAVQDTQRSGVRFRASEGAGCPTPFRLFHPDLDILYLNDYQSSFIQWCWRPSKGFHGRTNEDGRIPEFRSFCATVRATRRFAFPADTLQGSIMVLGEFLAEVASKAPEKLSWEIYYVVPTTRYTAEMDETYVHATFWAPGRRCRLEIIDESEWERILVPRRRLADYPSERLRDMVAEAPRTMPHNTVMEESWPPLDMNTIKLTAATFVQYQRDGTWSEVCASRMYLDEDIPNEVPLAERPDPLVQRVQDREI